MKVNDAAAENLFDAAIILIISCRQRTSELERKCLSMESSTARRFVCRALIICLLTCLIVNGATKAEAPEESAWWENEALVAVGYGVPSASTNFAAQARLLARQAAKSDAYRNLASQVENIRITADSTMIKSEINALVVGAQVVSEEYDEFGGCTIVMTVPIYGVQNSVAKSAFKRVNKRDFPAPAPTVDEKNIAGNYTGIIIDCGDLELNPVLSPAISNDAGQTIYSYSHLDYDDVIERGMIGYVRQEVPTSDSAAAILGATATGSMSRAGQNPLTIKAMRLNQDGSCPVISTHDANKILKENQASHFLNGGSVIFMSRRIRGMRL